MNVSVFLFLFSIMSVTVQSVLYLGGGAFFRTQCSFFPKKHYGDIPMGTP